LIIVKGSIRNTGGKGMKKIVAVVMALNMIFLSGCWDTRELNELGLVMAVGVDKKKDGEYFTVTAQIAKPSSAAGQGGKSGGGDQPVWVGSADGNTIFEAIRNLAKFSSRRIMWAHNNVIIIGESLAEDDITPVIDFFTGNHELRMKTWVAIAHGDARPYIFTKTGIENIPAMSIAELFRYHELAAESVGTDMVHLFRDYKSESMQPLVSAVNMPKGNEAQSNTGPQIELEGAAVFKGSKLVGWISPEEARGLAWVRNEMSNAIIALNNVGKEKQKISLELKDTKVKLSADMSGEIPSITIDIKGKGDITEIDFPTEMSMDELKASTEKEAVDIIRKEIKLAVDKVQKEFKSDVLGFGRIVHIEDKEEWYKRLDSIWEEIYPQVAVNINVSINIQSAALFQQTTTFDKRKRKD